LALRVLYSQSLFLERIMTNYTTNQQQIVVEIPSDMSDLAPGFLESRKKEIPSLEEALSRQDFAQIRIWGHNMAGCGAGYGFPQITEIGREMETAALAKNPWTIVTCIEQLSIFVGLVKVVYY
jgi:HPt (histidine-containing phosphotransfer) domain-containing protein